MQYGELLVFRLGRRTVASGTAMTSESRKRSLEELLPWPLVALDFEASSLGSSSYPIEVGLCIWDGPDEPIRGWSTLIKPTETWLAQGEWNPASATIHGINPDELLTGMEPTDVVAALNSLVGDRPAWCDGGAYDVHWARTLTRASGILPIFQIGHWDMLTSPLDQTEYMRMVRWLDRAPPRHRARDDAERLIKALARGLRLQHGSSLDLLWCGV